MTKLQTLRVQCKRKPRAGFAALQSSKDRSPTEALAGCGGGASHGSMHHRAPGSIGASSYPSRVVKGMRMGGHMGADRVTTRNLKILRIDQENNLLLVEGAVPGGPNATIVVRKAIAPKKIKVAQLEPVKKKGKK